ncbi:DUF397 domain-containing protein [Spirillospora sp. NPDC048911]|uniref:DUF397 domain-containing protein n=1 Tax=Spirillospora sp. NPDC048911 TaxID=3364527 RepID=UPI00371C3D97
MTSRATNPSNVVWRKSSRSGSGNACVEVARTGRSIGVRDSRDPDGPRLIITPAALRAVVSQIRAGLYNPSTQHD